MSDARDKPVKLTPAQIAELRRWADREAVGYHFSVTTHAATGRALFERGLTTSDFAGSLTDAGRAWLAEHESEGKP